MTVISAILVAFSMFSAIPVPQPKWNEKTMKYSMAAFPLVGVVTGLCLWGVLWLLSHLNANGFVCAAAVTLIPVIVPGGIHPDGYTDTADALASHADKEKRYAILADPHVGSFAVIRLVTLFLATFALLTQFYFDWRSTAVLGASYVLSRALSGLAVVEFPVAEKSSLAKQFSDTAGKGVVIAFLMIFAIAACTIMLYIGRWVGAAAILAAFAVFVHYRILCTRKFDGLSGDLAGWFLTKAEFWMLFVIVLVQRLTEVLA